MAEHKAIQEGERHPIHNWRYVDEDTRTSAALILEADVGKIAWQTDNNSFWVLTAVDPVEWQPISGASVLPGGTTGQIFAKASDDDGDVEWIDAPMGGGGGDEDPGGEITGLPIDDGTRGPWSSSTGSVRLLLHGNGADDSTTMVDSSDNAFAPSEVVGDGASITTSRKKFGSGSVHFATGGGLKYADDSRLEIGGSDFTIRGWIWCDEFGTAADIPLMGKWGTTSDYGFIVLAGYQGQSVASTKIRVVATATGSYNETPGSGTDGYCEGIDMVPGAWNFIVINRRGGNLNCSIGGAWGTMKKSSSHSTDVGYNFVFYNTAVPFWINSNAVSGDGASMGVECWWDEFEFIIGEGVYDGSTPFTPPDGPFSLADWHTLRTYSQVIALAASDETTPITSGVKKFTFRMPFAFWLTEVRASLTTGQTSGSILTFDLNEEGTSILSTRITIPNGQRSSKAATTQPVIASHALSDDAEITVDFDSVGDGTATGAKIYLIGVKL